MDRNRTGLVTGCEYIRSLSARRAWIEMVLSGRRIIPGIVALRKESVDRNVYQLLAIGKYAVALRKESVDRNLAPVMYLPTSPGESLSARRAWIEIQWVWMPLALPVWVALRKESVDRNSICPTRSRPTGASRSPQGERG